MQPTGWLSKPSVSTMQLVSTCTSPRSKRAMRSARARPGISPVTVSAVTPSARNAAATASAWSTVAQKKMVRRSAARSFQCSTTASLRTARFSTLSASRMSKSPAVLCSPASSSSTPRSMVKVRGGTSRPRAISVPIFSW